MVVDRSNVDHIMRGLQSTEGVRLHNHRKKLRQRFDIIKKLGQGTYGKVQLGINKETGQEVAIKTIKKCKIETDADLVRIRREIQIMSSVRHPNIIHIYEVFENREKIVLVMEYAAGGELYDYLSERKVLEETEARRIFRQISTAIYYCHKHKICHRDLKLENILLDEHGNAKIADFGLSNVFDGQRLLSTYCGSPLYASPEIVKGTPYHGPEVDCWSLGVLLYTLVYGAMPFDGSNFKRLVKQISQGDYFEPKEASTASQLIRDMLTVNSPDRATIEQICSHWWVNQGFNVSCLDIAEDLANQTPVRLDLLLSLAPPPENTEKIVVTDDQRAVPQEGPPRSMSVGSFMELDANAEERVRSFVAREVPSDHTSNEKTMKRKLEPVPSKSFSGARKKERTKPDTEEKEEPVPIETEESAKNVESNNTVMEIDAEMVKPEEQIESQEISAKEDQKCIDQSSDIVKKVEEESDIVKTETEKPSPEAISKDKPTRKSVKLVKKKVVEKKDSEFEKEENEASEDKAIVKKKKTESPSRGENELKKEIKPEDKPEEKEVDKKFKKEETTKKILEKVKEDEREEKEKTPAVESSTKPVERRKSKIFETAEKFMTNDQKSPNQDKPKKVYIPGVKVSDFAKAFERRSSTSMTMPLKSSPPKKILSKESSPADKKPEVKPPEKKSESPEIKKENNSSQPKHTQNVSAEETKETSPKAESKDSSPESKIEENYQPVAINDEKLMKLKDSARNVIASALAEEEKKKLKKQILKPPVPKTKTEDLENKKKNLTLQIGKETATVQVHTPENTKFLFEPEFESAATENKENVQKPKEKKTTKLEITLKSNTLPRRTTKAEVRLASPQVKPEIGNFRTEVERRVGDPSHVYSTQRSEVAFPVSAATKPVRSMSLEPEGRIKQKPLRESTRERIIPIQFEGAGHREETEARDRVKELDRPREGKPKHPYQRTWSLRSNSLSRQSTQDSDTESTVSAPGEPIKKSPREFIIPIAVEGGGYVTPRATSLEPSESMTSKRNIRPFSRKFNLWSDNGSEDESPFSTLQRHSSRDLDDSFRLHRLRSSRPTRPAGEKGDSGSGSEEEEEDDDGFELLTAENLFSTLLSRVRSLTQRLNVEDGMRPGFPSSRLLSNHFGPSERLFSNLHQPLTRISDRSEFGRSLSRGMENGSNTWSRGDLRNSDSNRSVSRENSKPKRSDSDTESLSESSSASHQRKLKGNEEKKSRKLHHHSRTRSVPLSLGENQVPIEHLPRPEGNKSVYMPSRMWTAKAYEKKTRESPSSKYRSEIPKLLRPTSLLVDSRQDSKNENDNEKEENESAKPKEKDFYDILAEKYGITNVKRYDLPPERRQWMRYESEKRRMSSADKREESEEKETDKTDDLEKKSASLGKPKKDNNLSEKYKTPSEKLAAVLNRLEGLNDKQKSPPNQKAFQSGKTSSSTVPKTNGKTREEEKLKSQIYSGPSREGTEKSKIPKKVGLNHHSDALNGSREKNTTEMNKASSNESTPEKSVLNKYLRYYRLDEGKKLKGTKEDSVKPENNKIAGKEGEISLVKSKYLTSLERKLDRLKTSSEKKYVDKAIRSLRESSLGPSDVSSENVLIKRAVSLSDCPSYRNSSQDKTQSTVNSVIGMFNKIEKSDNKKKESDRGGGDKSKIPVFRKPEIVVPKIESPHATVKTVESFTPSYPRRPSYLSGNDLIIPKPCSPFTFDDSNHFLSPDSESFDSWSICSDLGNPDDVIPKTHVRHGDADDISKESVSDRIRRKSFYTRFNARKKPRRSSLLLSRSYEPEFDTESIYNRSFSVNTGDACSKPSYYRSVSTGDEHTKIYAESRPRPFYKSQATEGSTTANRRDSSDWSRNPSYLRSGSQSPSSFVSFTLPRNFTTFDGGRNHRSRSVYNSRSVQAERPYSPSRPLSPRPLSPSIAGSNLDLEN